MVEAPDPTEAGPPPMFWCRICQNILSVDAAGEIDRSIQTRGRSYPSGNCTKCMRQFGKVDVNDQLELRRALEGLTDLRQLTKEPA